MAKLANLQKLQELANLHTSLTNERVQWQTATQFHEDSYTICLTNEEKEYRNGMMQPPRIYVDTSNIDFSVIRESVVTKLNARIAEIEKEVESL